METQQRLVVEVLIGSAQGKTMPLRVFMATLCPVVIVVLYGEGLRDLMNRKCLIQYCLLFSIGKCGE